MKLVFVIHSMSAGGAERVVSHLANNWAEKGWTVAIAVFEGTKSFYPLHPSITLVPVIGSWKKTGNFFKKMYYRMAGIIPLYRFLKKNKPAIVLSFMLSNNIITTIVARLLHIPVIISERIHPDYFSAGFAWGLLQKIIFPYLYPRADALVVQTSDIQNWFSARISMPVYKIPNPVILPLLSKQGNSVPLPKPCIIAMGRLHHQKGFDILICAFSSIAQSFPEWSLIIIGEGPERDNLERLTQTLHVQGQVKLTGLVSNSLEYLRQGDIFVLSSRMEGFPNVLCEAMACGLPVISTDCPSGPGEIITDGMDGLLVPADNPALLAKAMERLILHEEERTQLSSHALAITGRFDLHKICSLWEDVISAILVPYSK